MSDREEMTTENPIPVDPNAPPPPKFYPQLYRRLRILKWLALVGGVVMLGGGAYEYAQGVRLKTTGLQTAGKLFSSREVATGKGRTSYRLMLDYQPTEGGTVYRKEFIVAQAAYEQAKQAGQATVTYLPSDPETSAVGEQVNVDSEPLAIGGGLLLVAAGVWYYQRREWKKIHAYITGG